MERNVNNWAIIELTHNLSTRLEFLESILEYECKQTSGNPYLTKLVEKSTNSVLQELQKFSLDLDSVLNSLIVWWMSRTKKDLGEV